MTTDQDVKDMVRGREHKWALLAAIFTGGIFALLHQCYVTRVHADALYMDSLRLVYQLEQWLAGRMSFMDFWRQGADHHGFINQLVLWANVTFFSLNVELANRLTGVAIAGVSSVLVYVFVSGSRRTAQSSEALGYGVLAGRLAISCVFVVLCFSWAGFELLTLDLGLPLWLKNLSFVLYFAAYSRYLAGSDGNTSVLSISLAVAGPVIVLVFAMGWSYAFVLSVLSIHMLDVVVGIREGKKIVWRKFAPAAMLLLALLVYVLAGYTGPAATAASGRGGPLAISPLAVADLALYALGAGWMGMETASANAIPIGAFMLLGGVSVAIGVYGFWQHLRRGLRRRSLLPLFLMSYSALTALALAVARGTAGAAAVVASRYYMDVVMFLVGAIWLWYEDVEVSGVRRAPLNSCLFIAFVVAVLFGQKLTYWREWDAAPYRGNSFVAMHSAIYRGVPDAAAAELLQSPLSDARLGASTLREKRLGLWSKTHLAAACRGSEVSYVNGWQEKEGQTRWSAGQSELLLPLCSCDFTARVYLPSTFSRRQLDISSDTGTKRQFALEPGQTSNIDMPASPVPQRILISLSRTTVPVRDVPGSLDGRTLGALWSNVGFSCGPQH